MAPDLILAADFGTSALKLGAVRQDMTLAATAHAAYPLHLPAPGQAEQNPDDWWQALITATQALHHQIPDLAQRVGAISLSAQMAGVIALDDAGRTLRPALVWLDKRSAPILQAQIARWPRIFGYNMGFVARSLRLANGAPSLNGMDPPGKMLWIAAHEPEIYARTRWFVDVKDWLVHRATGVIATTAESANLTWAMDTRAGHERWSAPLSRALGIDQTRLPPIIAGDAQAGELTAEAAQALGLEQALPVMGGTGDVTATALGTGAVGNGKLHICLSSSAWVAGFFPRRVINPFAAYATLTSALDNRPLLIATQECAGAALGWLAALHGQKPDSFYEALGAWQPDDPFLLPWFAGERVPVDNERVRGVFAGLSLTHDLAALKRAALEGVALNTAWAFHKVAARERDVHVTGAIPVTGGAAANPALVQCLADALDHPLHVGETAFTGVRGAATLAAPLLGWYRDPWEAASAPIPERRLITPDPARVRALKARAARLAPLRKTILAFHQKNRGPR
ncbi:MAG: FGGY family carbohydrate kinase [Pseudomonadota bacterium]